ncbi:glycosyltransferase [soil metagenome]
MPQVSVVIPLHNPGAYIREAIQSVQDQTFKDFELILIDDASTEDLSWIEQQFPDVRMIRQMHGGVSVARNNGILNSCGDYVAFMDQDDMWAPTKLERQVECLNSDDTIGVCYCELQLVDKYGKAISPEDDAVEQSANGPKYFVELGGEENQSTEFSRMHQAISYFSTRFVVPSTVMLRKRCLSVSGLLDPFIPFSGDFDLIIKLGSNFKIARIPGSEVYYRRHDKNFSLQYEVCKQEVEQLISKYSKYAAQHGDLVLAREARKLFTVPSKIYAAQAFDRCRQSVRERDVKSSLRHFLKAFSSDPLYVSTSIAKWMSLRIPVNQSH